MNKEELYKLIRDENDKVREDYCEFIKSYEDEEPELTIDGVVFKMIASIGGGEGGERRVQKIFQVGHVCTCLWRETGEYDSYNGTEFFGLGNPQKVKPIEKITVVYVGVKE